MTQVADGQMGEAVPTVAPPDWNAITDEIACPLCDYNLRGLAEPRCPECGYRFAWREMLDPKRQRHPFVFEHHPSRNIWSFTATFLHGWRPIKFWNSLHPAQRSRPFRLVLYGLICLSLVTLIQLASYCLAFPIDRAIETHQSRESIREYLRAEYRRRVVDEQYGSADVYIDQNFPLPTRSELFQAALQIAGNLKWSNLGAQRAFWMRTVPIVFWPLLTCMALLVFIISMRRKRIRTVHVFRCIIYSADVFIWASLLGLAWQILWIALNSPTIDVDSESLTNGLLIAGAILFANRLWRAYQRYMRFNRAFAVVLASQIIVALIILNGLVLYELERFS